MRYVLSRCRYAGRGLWRGHDVVIECSLKPTANPMVLRAARLGGKTNRGDELEQSRERFPKTLFALSRYRISKVRGSEDLLSRSPMHVGTRDGVDYGGGAAKRKKQNLDALRFADSRCV